MFFSSIWCEEFKGMYVLMDSVQCDTTTSYTSYLRWHFSYDTKNKSPIISYYGTHS